MRLASCGRMCACFSVITDTVGSEQQQHSVTQEDSHCLFWASWQGSLHPQDVACNTAALCWRVSDSERKKERKGGKTSEKSHSREWLVNTSPVKILSKTRSPFFIPLQTLKTHFLCIISSNNYLQWSFASPTIQARFTNDFLNVGSVVMDTLQRARQSYLENRVQTRQQPQARRLFNLLREKPHVCGLFLFSHETLGWRKQLCYNTLLSVLYTDRSPELTVQHTPPYSVIHTHTHACFQMN